MSEPSPTPIPADDRTPDSPSPAIALPDDRGLNGPNCRQPAEMERLRLRSRLEGHRDHTGGSAIARMAPARTRLGGPRRVVSAAFADYDPSARKSRRD